MSMRDFLARHPVPAPARAKDTPPTHSESDARDGDSGNCRYCRGDTNAFEKIFPEFCRLIKIQNTTTTTTTISETTAGALSSEFKKR